MPQHSFTPMLGKRLRVTALDDCGSIPTDTPTSVVSDGFITITLSSEVEEGTEIIVRNAAGQLCVNEKLADSFKRFTIEIEFCGVNPELLTVVTIAEPYEDYAGDVAGFTVAEGQIDKQFALELWTGMSGAACAPGQTGEASGYLLLPYIQSGVMGDITIDGENAVTFSMTGAYTKGGNQWGVGRFNVVYNLGGTNEVQTITTTGAPTGGTFSLTFAGQTTAPLAYNAAAAAVQTALQGLSTVGAGNVTVTGGPGPGTPYAVTFGGALGLENVLQIVAAHSYTGGTTPAIAVVTTTQGVGGVPSKLPTALDPLDHLLLIDTAVAPPPVSPDPVAVPAA